MAVGAAGDAADADRLAAVGAAAIGGRCLAGACGVTEARRRGHAVDAARRSAEGADRLGRLYAAVFGVVAGDLPAGALGQAAVDRVAADAAAGLAARRRGAGLAVVAGDAGGGRPDRRRGRIADGAGTAGLGRAGSDAVPADEAAVAVGLDLAAAGWAAEVVGAGQAVVAELALVDGAVAVVVFAVADLGLGLAARGEGDGDGVGARLGHT